MPDGAARRGAQGEVGLAELAQGGPLAPQLPREDVGKGPEPPLDPEVDELPLLLDRQLAGELLSGADVDPEPGGGPEALLRRRLGELPAEDEGGGLADEIRELARATEARIFETFSSSCSSQGFGTRNRRCRSSPGTMPWRRRARTTFSGTSSQSELIWRPSKSRRTSVQGPRRSVIVSSNSGHASTRGFHSRCSRTLSARSGSPAGSDAADWTARASCSRRCAVGSGCFVPVSRSVSRRGFSRNLRRAAASHGP